MPYIDYSMSIRAAEAYENGEKPLSKWTKAALLEAAGDRASLLSPLTVSELRDLLLTRSSWHHTSCRYNATDFWSVDEDTLEELTEETVSGIIAARKPKAPKAPKAEPRTIRAEVTFTVWEGRYANYRRPKKVTETVTYREGEKMISTSCGMKRLSSMEKIRELSDGE